MDSVYDRTRLDLSSIDSQTIGEDIGEVLSIAFSTDGKQLALAGRDKTV